VGDFDFKRGDFFFVGFDIESLVFKVLIKLFNFFEERLISGF
jgi:hypothetical protein